MTDNKFLWKTTNPLNSNKSCMRDRIFISKKVEILKTVSETALTIKQSKKAETDDFFWNMVKNAHNSRSSEHDSVAENITGAALIAILKYKHHSSIFAIQTQCEAKHFVFWGHQKASTQVK